MVRKLLYQIIESISLVSNDIKVVGFGGSVAFAGVGRANYASGVGYAHNVYGVAGSNTFNLVNPTIFADNRTLKRQNMYNGMLVSR